MTLISYEHKLIFLKTRKTGGSSVEMWLSAIAGEDDVIALMDPDDEAMRAWMGGRVLQNLRVARQRYRLVDHVRAAGRDHLKFVSHMPAHEVRRYVGERVWRSFLKVTVERDAYERAVSMFRFKTRGLDQPPSIVDFLRRFPTYKLANAPIYSIKGAMVADIVLDHRTLGDDVAGLQRLLGVPEVPLGRAKTFNAPARDVASMLGEEGRRVVDQVCRDDLALRHLDRRVQAVLG